MAYGVRLCRFHDADGVGNGPSGRTYRWEFSEQFGPVLVDKDGDPLKVQPISERHEFWKVFEPWHQQYLASKGAKKGCC